MIKKYIKTTPVEAIQVTKSRTQQVSAMFVKKKSLKRRIERW